MGWNTICNLDSLWQALWDIQDILMVGLTVDSGSGN